MLEIVKLQSKNTYKNKEGKEVHYYNYALKLENGKRIMIRTSFAKDIKYLDAVAKYEGK